MTDENSINFHNHNSAGKCFFSLNNYPKAKERFLRSLQIDPDQSDILSLLAIVCFLENDFSAAVLYLTRAVALAPASVEAFSNRGLAYHHLHEYEQALVDFDKCLDLDPTHHQAYLNKGCTLIALKRYQEALISLQRAYEIQPSCTVASLNLSVVYSKMEQYPSALRSIELVIAHEPNNPQWHLEKGLILENMGYIDQAISAFREALRISPDFFDPLWNLSLLHLAKGEFVLGWQLYENRFKLPHFQHMLRNYPFARLQNLNVEDKVVFVYHEQGFGDIIQFSRYLLLLKERCKKVVFEVPFPLQSIMMSLSKDIDVVTKLDCSADYHIPLLSLPHLFGTQLATIPFMERYLYPSSKEVNRWKNKINGKRLSIGLVLTGSDHGGSKKRIPSSALLPLLDLDVDFYILQNQILQDHLSFIAMQDNFYEFHREINDFSDTAALIAHMDLIISVDTAVAHLAAAIGKPVWILLSYVADFRWLQNISSSPWYPSVTLYRQDERRSFDQVIKKVADDIKSFKKRSTQVKK
jgi:tetratricopeptide (TPR) repeat protein